RVRVAVRAPRGAAGEPDEPVFTTGDLRVDLEHRRVFLAEREVHLTPTEYKVLLALVRQSSTVLPHRYMLKEVWVASPVSTAPALRVHMAQLPHKLEKDPAQPRHLL